MFEVALTAAACVRSGTRVDVAWVVDADLGGLVPDHTEALALTPGGGRVGRLLRGALDDQLAERASVGGAGRFFTLQVSDLEAAAAGLTSGGIARCLMVPGSDLPAELWERLQSRESLCLVVELADGAATGSRVIGTEDVSAEGPEVAALWERGTSGTLVEADRIVTVLRPVPTMVLAGGGPVLAALAAMAPLLGWRVTQAPDPGTANGLVVGLGPLDKVVLAMHDDDLAGSVLASALSGRAGYIAALGSRAKQRSRDVWLTDRGVDGLERIHTPAGLDIGADGPAEVAVAILGQAIAVGAVDRAIA